MRIYSNVLEAIREVERDLFEMGVKVVVQSMQDKVGEFETIEMNGYGFKIVDHRITDEDVIAATRYVWKDDQADNVIAYIDAEFKDRIDPVPSNPGRSYIHRQNIWAEYIHSGKFAYTYSERINPQFRRIFEELKDKPGTRQAIINIHSNIQASNILNMDSGIHWVTRAADLENMGGSGRIPCSLHYQLMIRDNKLSLIYGMRSCDFLTHFVVDICLAMKLQAWFADHLNLGIGTFTYFTGSLHAYHTDMKQRGIF